MHYVSFVHYCFTSYWILRALIAGSIFRKVYIIGHPLWHAIPKADFIASLVFGGPLELIQCFADSAAVTFINAADARSFYEITANGKVFRADTSAVYTAETRMSIEPLPIGSYVQDCVYQGVTRCVRAFGIDSSTSMDGLRLSAEGRLNARGGPARDVERSDESVNSRGVSTIALYAYQFFR